MPDQPDRSITLPVAFVDDLSRADSVEAVLGTGAQWLPRLIAASRGCIAVQSDGRMLARAYREGGARDPQIDRIKFGALTPHGAVLRGGRPAFLDEAAMRADSSGSVSGLLAAGIRSMLIVPMLGGAAAMGVISVGRESPKGFDASHCRKLTAIGKWIASQAQLMQEIRAKARLAETDALTGLANRARLMRVLDGPGALHLPGADGSVLGVLHIDLDHFKQVNDSLGHAVGDAILCHVAQVMRAAASNHDLVARIGGDEFLVVTRSDPDGHRLAKLADAIVTGVARPVCAAGFEVQAGVSIGTAVASRSDRTADRLIGNADIALYEVKRGGRGGVRAFCGDMRAAQEARQRMMTELRNAVDRQALVPYFQPQVSLSTGRFCGFEMLARWPHPHRGVLAPEAFLDLAEELGLLDRIDAIVRRKGLVALRTLRAEGWHAPKMSFNASAKTLSDPDLAEALLWEVVSHGLEPGDLVLEFRDPHLLDVPGSMARQNVAELAAAGFRVELDDFGTACAALGNLASLDVSGVKLEAALIAPLPDPCCEIILRAIIALAGELGLSVAAKGVETAGQFAQLRKLGCDIAQGFGVSKPLPLDALVEFMRGYGRAPVSLAN